MPNYDPIHTRISRRQRIFFLVLQLLFCFFLYLITRRKDIVLVIIAIFILFQFTSASYYLDRYNHHAPSSLRYSQSYHTQSMIINKDSQMKLKHALSLQDACHGQNKQVSRSGHSYVSLSSLNESVKGNSSRLLDIGWRNQSQKGSQRQEYHREVIDEIKKAEYQIFNIY